MHVLRQATLPVFSLLLLLSTPLTSQAAEETWKKDRFFVGIGLYRPNIDTEIRVDDAATGISGTLLNLEDDLDLSDRKTQLTLDAHFRFAKRHAIEFEYVKLKREDESNIGFQINFDDEVFVIDEDIRTTFKTEVSRLAYRFSFLNNEKHELSAAIGLHVTDLTVGLNLVDETDEQFNDVTAPLPTLGAAWKYHFNDQWTFHIRGEWLDIEIDEVEGKLTAGLAEVTWYPWRNFGFGLGYHIWDLNVDATEDDLTGSVQYRYDGPKLNLNVRF
jgi:hypothetical protein